MSEVFTLRVGREVRHVALDLERLREGFGVSEDDNRDTRIFIHICSFLICVA